MNAVHAEPTGAQHNPAAFYTISNFNSNLHSQLYVKSSTITACI